MQKASDTMHYFRLAHEWCIGVCPCCFKHENHLHGRTFHIKWYTIKQYCSSISCGTAMREKKRGDITDGIYWYCPTCKTTKSIRESSFFSKSQLPLRKWMLVMYWWVRQYPVSNCKDEVEIEKHNAIDMYPSACSWVYGIG